jgi:4-hydroxy-3-methylbut-2-enyl diphosphate reductase
MVKYITPYGFCFGVKNSLNKVREIRKSRPQARIVFVHPLVHNQATNDLIYKETNATAYSPDIPQKDYRGAFLVFPAHGMTNVDRRFAKSLQANYIDCTCPVLINTKKQIIKNLEDGKNVFFLGKRNHSESKFMCDISKEITFIGDDEIETYDYSKLNNYSSIYLYPQSTLSKEKLDKFNSNINKYYKGKYVPHHLCVECLKRWNNGKSIIPAAKDSFIVVTDPSSSNGTEFANILRNEFIMNEIYTIQSYEELKELKEKIDYRGDMYIGSATSTPNKLVEKIANNLRIWSFLKRLVPHIRGRK